MKKFLCFVITLIFCTSFSACGNDNNDTKIIEAGEFYRIIDVTPEDASETTQLKYEILDPNGAVIFSDTTDRPLNIEMINDTIVDIGIGMGTGEIVHKYYNSENIEFSKEFSYVVANYDDLVAYIYAPNGFENRKLVVEGAFAFSSYYKEFVLDFANDVIPVIKADFSEDGKILNIVYIATDGTEKSVALTL